MAYSIVRGLRSMHQRGIVHRDLGARNYLINIPKGKPGRRKVDACIADLGRAEYVKKLKKKVTVQGTPSYVAPEALNPKKLKPKDSYATDVYAAGCVLFELFYEKTFPWHSRSFLKQKGGYNKYVRCLEKATKKRRLSLYKKKRRTCKQEFEYLILRMVNKNPKKRPATSTLCSKLKSIHKRAAR